MKGKVMKCKAKWYISSIQGPSLPHSDTVFFYFFLVFVFRFTKRKSKSSVRIKMDITADRLINTNIQISVTFQANYKGGPAFLS